MAGAPRQVTPGWNFPYIGLTVFLALLTGIAGFFVNTLLTQRTALRRRIIVLSADVRNIIPPAESLPAIVAQFSLRSDPKVKLKSFFNYEVKIRNDGEEDFLDGELLIQSPPSVTLLRSPQIQTFPQGLKDPMHLVQQTPNVRPDLDVWQVGFLHRRETVSFAYLGFSSNYMPSSRLQVTLRKKDWDPLYASTEPLVPPPGSFFATKEGAAVVFAGVLAVLLVITSSTQSLIQSALSRRKEYELYLQSAERERALREFLEQTRNRPSHVKKINSE